MGGARQGGRHIADNEAYGNEEARDHELCAWTCLLAPKPAFYFALPARRVASLSSSTLCSRSMHFMVLYSAPVDPA